MRPCRQGPPKPPFSPVTRGIDRNSKIVSMTLIVFLLTVKCALMQSYPSIAASLEKGATDFLPPHIVFRQFLYCLLPLLLLLPPSPSPSSFSSFLTIEFRHHRRMRSQSKNSLNGFYSWVLWVSMETRAVVFICVSV